MIVSFKNRRLTIQRTNDACPSKLKLLCLLPIIYRIVQATGWINLTLFTVFVLAIVTIVSIVNYNSVMLSARTNKFFFILFFFYVICILTALLSSNISLSFQYLLILSIGILLFLNLSNDLRWIYYFFKVCFIISMVSVVTTFLSYFAYDTFKSIFFPFMNQSAREFSQNYVSLFNQHSGIWGQTGSNGFFIVMGIPLVLTNIKRKNHSVINIAFLALIIIALLFTGKRGDILWGALSVIIALSIDRYDNKNPLKLFLSFVGFICLAIGIIIVMYNISPLVALFIDNFFDSSNGDYSSGRFGMYSEAITIFKQNPFIGIGIGAFKSVSPFQTNVHNDFLQMFAETGVLGGILFAVMMINALFRTISNNSLRVIKNNREYVAVSFCAFYMVLSMITSIVFYEYGMLLYLFVILASVYFNKCQLKDQM